MNNVFGKLYFIYNTFNTSASVIDISVNKNTIVYTSINFFSNNIFFFVFS